MQSNRYEPNKWWCGAAFAVRSALPAVLAMALSASTAEAGDFADRSIYGFSPDGAYFAFEEYGVQDGSGFTYSNVYVIDTAQDSWLPGTPIRVLDEDSLLAETRAAAFEEARPILAEHQVGSQGDLAVYNPLTETSADPHFVSFRPQLYGPSSDYQLVLEEYALPAPDCPDMGQPFQGFRLILKTSTGESIVLNEDTTLPSSRKCPLSYGISDVLTYQSQTDGAVVIVVLVNVFSVGFEGPDRRFIAVATR